MSSYRFVPVDACNMCGSGPERHRVLGRRLDRSQGWRPRARTGVATTVVRCTDCGLLFANPLPVPERLSDHYDMDPEEYFGEERAGGQVVVFQSEIETARRLLGPGDSVRALDIGAGTGRSMAAMRDAGFDVWGIEPSEAFRAHAIATFGFDEERLQSSAIEDASFPADSFDFVTFGAVLEHLADPSGAIRNALTWLRPGGVVHAEIPSARWLIGRMLNGYHRVIGSGLVTNLSPMHPPYHLYEFTAESFERNGLRGGYRVEEIRRFVGDTFTGGLAGRALAAAMKATGTELQMIVWLRATEG